jgi:hypothetical protein
MSTPLRSRVFPASLVLLCLLICEPAAQAVVCRSNGIRGFEEEHAKAESIIGRRETFGLANTRVFLTVKDTPKGRYLYAHSNYRSSGAGYPTKLAEPLGAIRDLRKLVGNLVYTDVSDYNADTLNTARALKDQIQFFADESFFETSGQPLIDLPETSSIFSVGADGKIVQLFPTGSARPPPFAVALSKNLRTKFRPGHSPATLLGRLQAASFSASTLGFLNLIEETPVESAIEKAGLTEHVTPIKHPLTEEAIFETVRAHAGKTLATLFHSDGSHLLVQDSAGNPTLKIPLAKLAEVAVDVKCTLLGLGCSSGQGRLAIGAMESFNPVDAVASLQRALRASSMAQFAELLADDTFHLIFDDVLLDQALVFEAVRTSPHAGAADSAPGPSVIGLLVLPRLVIVPYPPPSPSSLGGGGSGADLPDAMEERGQSAYWWGVGAGLLLVVAVLFFGQRLVA